MLFLTISTALMRYTLLSLLVLSTYSIAFAQEQICQTSSQYILMPLDFNDGNVTFAIDTPSSSYKPYSNHGLGLNNSSPAYKLFAYCTLESDPAAKMTLTADTGGVKVDTVEIKNGQPVTINFTLRTSLKPAQSQQTFPSIGIVHLLTQFQGIYLPFATDSVKFTATFPPLPGKGVAIEIHDNISLSINPNPSYGLTTISISSSKSEPAILEIYDMLGNRKALLANGEYINSSSDFRIDASGFSAGTYFARLVAGGKVILKKIILK